MIDAEHAGAKVTLSQERVRLRADVWNPAASSLWLDARSARHLGLVLIARAAELDLAELADAADDTPGVPADSVIARHRDLGSAETLCGDRNLCARPYLHATGDHESFAGTVWAADGGPR